MVAPVQGSVGQSSTAPETQDYLNELTNFYNKPENEGKETEFVAPNGNKFKIQDASYLSSVKSNVNTGKLNGPEDGVNGNSSSKSVSKDADNAIGSYAADKKAKADKQGNSSQATEAEAGKSKSKGEDAKKGLFAPIEKLEAGQATAEGKLSEKTAAADANRAATKDAFKEMEANNKKLDTISKKNTAKIKQNFAKAKAKMKAKAKKQAATAAKAAESESTTQSGSTMGFEGKLATTAGASSGKANDAASQKAWEDTMNGKIKVSTKAIAEETPKLINVKEAGEKAAQPMLDQADTSLKAAGEKKEERHDVVRNGWLAEVVQVAMIAIGIIQCCTLPTMASGIATIAGALIGGVVAGINAGTQAGQKESDINKFNDQAEQQKTQSVQDRKQAIVQAQASNAKILQANQNLNKISQELSGGLSSSEMPAFSIDGMDEAQLESVKQERYDQIMAHEQTHASIIGGTPVIETDANGVAIGGYVDIQVPSVDESDLEGTIEKAQRVIDAALAPSDPSSQDQNVASQAKDVLSKAQDLMEKQTEETEKSEEDKEENKEEGKLEKPKAEEVKPELQTKKAA